MAREQVKRPNKTCHFVFMIRTFKSVGIYLVVEVTV